MVLTEYAKRRILLFEAEDYRPPTISKMLKRENIFISRQAKFLLRVKATGSIARQAGSGRPTKLTREVKEIIEKAMRNDDETTAVQLHKILVDKQLTVGSKKKFPFATRATDGRSHSINVQLPCDFRFIKTTVPFPFRSYMYMYKCTKKVPVYRPCNGRPF